jgi:DNA-binding SARP family transcriptional activator
MIELRLLGALQVRSSEPGASRPELTQPKRVALLMYLALAEPAGLHARDRLLALFWPEADDASARHSLRNALHALRLSLGDDVVMTRGEAWVGLDFSRLRCDVLELRAALAQGHLDQALALWHGDLAPGFFVSGAPEFERWLDEQRAALGQAMRATAWKHADASVRDGKAELAAVRLALRLDPGHEPGARRLMELLMRAGDRAGALQVYQDLAAWLARELEAAPSAETRRLAEALRRADPVELKVRAMVVPTVPDAHVPAAPATPVVRRRALSRRLLTLGLAGVMAVCGGVYLVRKPAPRFDPAAEAERAVLRLPARYRTDTAAYSSYLRGLTLRFQFRFAESRDTLAGLVDREPLYVPGLYGLAHAWIFLALNDETDPDAAWPRVNALARRALALDSTAASAWLVLASEDMYRRDDIPHAGLLIERARALDSLEPDAPGMQSVWFRMQGEMDSAVALARTAERLDPLSLFFARLTARQLFFARRYTESRQAYGRLMRDFPGARVRSYRDLAELYSAMGQPREAVEWLRRERAASGDSAGMMLLQPVATDAAARQALARDARSTIDRLDRAVSAGDHVPPSAYAVAYATLGDTTATLAWLDSMLPRRDSYIYHVPIDPALDFVRGTPRYRQWEARARLPSFTPASGVGRRASGVRRQASGVRRQASSRLAV